MAKPQIRKILIEITIDCTDFALETSKTALAAMPASLTSITGVRSVESKLTEVKE